MRLALDSRALQLADTCSCCSELTLKQTRRLLEDDLQLPEKALDEEPHKSLIKHQVDEARRDLQASPPAYLTRAGARRRSCGCSWLSKTRRQVL